MKLWTSLNIFLVGILGICHSLLLSILTQSHQIELLTTSRTFPPYSLDLPCSSAHSAHRLDILIPPWVLSLPFPHPQHFCRVPLSLCLAWKTLIVPSLTYLWNPFPSFFKKASQSTPFCHSYSKHFSHLYV